MALRPDLSPPRRLLVSEVIAELARSLLVLSDQMPLHQRKAMIHQIELAVLGYLRESIPDPEDHQHTGVDGPGVDANMPS